MGGNTGGKKLLLVLPVSKAIKKPKVNTFSIIVGEMKIV
jgi:hypothetical protein